MIAVFDDEFKKEIGKLKRKISKEKKNNSLEDKINIVILTGKITYEFIKEKAKVLKDILGNINIDVRYVENNHFGTNITVTGLMVGKDILDTISDLSSDENIIIPDVCLKEDEEIFLDDVKLEDLKNKYKNIVISETSAKGFVDCIYNLYNKNI